MICSRAEGKLPQKKFGSHTSTGRKLDVIGEYLNMYQKALSGKFETSYIDAFAGSGEIPLSETVGATLELDEDGAEVIIGSSVRAMNVDPAFDRYIFIDNRKQCIESLRHRHLHNPNVRRSEYLVGDANIKVKEICTKWAWKRRRGVVFLDPFGSQVEWSTLEFIASTKALDLWYLFPAGLSVFRQISSDGSIDASHVPSLNRIFGTDKWREAFLQPSSQGDLFGSIPRHEKIVTAESAAQFMIERMKEIFRGGVLDVMLPLGKHSYPSYYLIFAWGNEAPKAAALAKKLSTAAIRATDRKHGRLI